MKTCIAVAFCFCMQITCSLGDNGIKRKASDVEPNHLKAGAETPPNVTVTDGRWRFDVPGQFVDVVFKSYADISGPEIALVREFQQEEAIPGLSNDYHPDHRPVSHHQLYVQSSSKLPSSRQLIGAPIEGHCRIGHTYFMASESGDYILSSALTFNEPQSVIQIFITWLNSGNRRSEIYRLTYDLEKDCQVHHFTPTGSHVMSLPNYDCPWASAVPSLDGAHIALIHHESNSNPYQVSVEMIFPSPGYTPSVFKINLDFYKVQFEAAIFFHWTEVNTFRIFGGSSAYEIFADTGIVLPIPFERKARIAPRTSSSRISRDESTVLMLDRENGNEPKEVPHRHEKPFTKIP